MNYTLNQLQIFLKIAETLSITKAAEELHLTQPAVSIQLKNFQAQFDMPLTEIVGRKIYITEFGKEIAASAERIIEQVYAINYKTAAYKGLLTGSIKISVVSTGKYVMPYFLSDFLKLHPEVELVMDVTNKRDVVESLSRNDVDFSLVSVLPPKLEIEKMELLKNKLYLVGNTERAFPEENTTTIFKDLPLIFREDGSGTLQTMMNYLSRNNIRFLKKMELKSNEAVKQAIISGMGYSVMPLIGLRNELLNKDLQIINVKGLPITTQWTLIWMKGKNHSPAAAAYLEYLNEHTQRIIADKFNWYEQY
ncbi:LysR family transcriptional regulator [Flavobacterium sp. D11R37]|uniref:LysR family transcriptional regulator n=1 Tax=Flavobacterium coralii TaxID=2838017 RepID=UPI001CA6476A|nr:LysR family transcriptional regulator [Flavobacterium coralii]MBY8961320.1 LysR family transcriptional regulator [Flavobacterium coralii]